MNEYPPGLVGVIAQDTARFSMFGASLSSLEVPPGTQVRWVMGGDVAANTNELCRTLIEGAPDAEWLWILGDDHVFSPRILGRLLDHEVDVVVPLCLTRNPPYKPVAFTGFVDGDGSMLRWRLKPDEYAGGLVPIHSAGDAGMLIRRPVLEAVERPWFEIGTVSNEHLGEDVAFCDKARAAGFDLYCDLDTPLGHCTTATVWPVHEPDGWTYGFGFPGGLKLTMPSSAWADADAELAAAGGAR